MFAKAKGKQQKYGQPQYDVRNSVLIILPFGIVARKASKRKSPVTFSLLPYPPLLSTSSTKAVFHCTVFVNAKLLTYPSPNSTLTLTSHLEKNVGLGEW